MNYIFLRCDIVGYVKERKQKHPTSAGGRTTHRGPHFSPNHFEAWLPNEERFYLYLLYVEKSSGRIFENLERHISSASEQWNKLSH